MWFIGLLRYITKVIKQSEETAITFISTFIPWLVPVVPAYITFKHCVEDLLFWLPVAVCVGISVEGLGLVSMYRMFQFLEHNRKYKDANKKSPWWIPALTYMVYIAIILSVNVLLDWQKGVNVYHVIAIGLLSTLSLPAGALIAVMAVHDERVAEHQNVLADRRTRAEQAKRSAAQQNVLQNVSERSGGFEQEAERSRKPASFYQDQILGLLEKAFDEGTPIPRVRDIVSTVGLDKEKDKGFVSTLRKNWAVTRGVTLVK